MSMNAVSVWILRKYLIFIMDVTEEKQRPQKRMDQSQKCKDKANEVDIL